MAGKKIQPSLDENPDHHLRTIVALTLFAAASLLRAQTTTARVTRTTTPSPTSAAAVSVPPEEEPIELSPLIVTSGDDQSCRAQNTLAGSRLNSALKDTPGVLDGLFAST